MGGEDFEGGGLILVGMPVHGAIDSAIRAAQCVLSQRADVELLICDDNSSDEDYSRLLAFVMETPRVDILCTRTRTDRESPNLNVAVNMLLDSVMAEDAYYLNLESDVYLEPGCLDNLVRALETHPEVAAASPLYTNAEGTHHLFSVPGHETEHPPLDALPEYATTPCHMYWAHLGSLLIRGEHARNPRIRIAEPFRFWFADFDYVWCLQKEAGPVLYVPEAHARHALSQSSGGRTSALPGPSFDEAWKLVHDKWGKA